MTTIAVHPAAENRRAFGAWAVKRRVRSIARNGFAVPEGLLSQIPTDLLVGAKVNGRVYVLAGELPADELDTVLDGGQMYSYPPPVDPVVAGFPRADDVPTTGAPAGDDDQDHATSL